MYLRACLFLIHIKKRKFKITLGHGKNYKAAVVFSKKKGKEIVRNGKKTLQLHAYS